MRKEEETKVTGGGGKSKKVNKGRGKRQKSK